MWAGRVKRAPRWMGNAGLEWLFRLIIQPRRVPADAGSAQVCSAGPPAEICRQAYGEVGEAMSRWQRIGYEYIMVPLGVVLTALGYNWFLIPNKIAAGGVSGIGTVFHYCGAGPLVLSCCLSIFPCSWL